MIVNDSDSVGPSDSAAAGGWCPTLSGRAACCFTSR